jgi:hypothetical protein
MRLPLPEEDQKQEPAKKKPYQKPDFRDDELFETTAACGKLHGGAGSPCHQAKKSS